MSRRRGLSGRTAPQLIEGVPAPSGPLFGALWRPQAYEFKQCNGRFPRPGDNIRFQPRGRRNPNNAFTEGLADIDDILRRTSDACGVVKIQQLSDFPVTPVPSHFGGVQGRWWFLEGDRKARVMHVDMRRTKPTEEPLRTPRTNTSGTDAAEFADEVAGEAPEKSPLLTQTILVTRALIQRISSGKLQHVITDAPIGDPGAVVMLTDGQNTLPVKILGEANKPNSLLEIIKPGPKPLELQLMSEAWAVAGARDGLEPIGFRQAVFTEVTTDMKWEVTAPTSHAVPELHLVSGK